jgi:hypothetical protein
LGRQVTDSVASKTHFGGLESAVPAASRCAMFKSVCLPKHHSFKDVDVPFFCTYDGSTRCVEDNIGVDAREQEDKRPPDQMHFFVPSLRYHQL